MPLSRFSLNQAINVAAIRYIGVCIANPRVLLPKQHLPSVSRIDFQHLHDIGIRYIIFDKDNTLTLAYKDEYHPSIVHSIASVRNIFAGKGLAILSNSIGTPDDKLFAGAIKCEKELGLHVIRHTQKKPDCLDEVLLHFHDVRGGVHVSPREICLVGDRLLTDVLFANYHGLYSVLVDPLNKWDDHPMAFIFRFFETYLILPLVRLLYNP